MTEVTETYILLRNRYWISKAFHESVRQQVEAAISRLERNRRRTLKQMCDRDYWRELSTGERVMAGIAVSFMVDCAVLPLTAAGVNQSNAKLYTLS